MKREKTYTPTDGMKTEAQRGLDWRSEYGRGGTEVGIARARDIVNGKNLPLDTVKRMHSFFSRHEVDKQADGFRPGEDGYPSNGRIAGALWGGDPGQAWARNIVEAEESRMADRKATLEMQIDRQGLVDSLVESFLEAINIVRVGIMNIGRAIKDVSEWDGSASRWPDTDAYCSACLIDVNEAAGRTEKAQSHCMLPIREPGDSADTYVRQAVYAASGGRGISQVKRPDDVPEAEWERAVKNAAGEIVKAYSEMDEEAPESVAEMARGLIATPIYGDTEQRAVGLNELAMMIYDKVEDTYGEMAILHDIYHANGEMFAIVMENGRMWQVPFGLDDMDEVQFGEAQQVKMDFTPAERSVTVTRQADGRYRATMLACTAILNRVGEIDTSELFDDFVYHFNSGDEDEVRIDFYHLPGSEVGTIDFVARDGYVLICSGLFDDDEIGRAFAEGIMRDAGYWGTSIMYQPTEGEMMEVGRVSIPAYTRGILRRVSVLPEQHAASLFTDIELGGKNRMNQIILDALKKLLGDNDELVGEVEQRVDGVNRAVPEDGLIARTTEDEQPPDMGGGASARRSYAGGSTTGWAN